MKVEFKQGQQFKIKSKGELKRAYEALKDEWDDSYDLNHELNDYEETPWNFISYTQFGVSLYKASDGFETIKSPFRKKKLGKKIKHKHIKPEDVGRTGFVDSKGDKGYFVFVGDNVNFSFHMVGALDYSFRDIPNPSYGNFYDSRFSQIPENTHVEVIPKNKQYYIFKNRKQLYKWLSR